MMPAMCTTGRARNGNRRHEGIAFESVADIQKTLPTGKRQKIEADVDALMTHWAGPEGGFILKDYYHSFYASIGAEAGLATPIMYEAFSRWSEKIYGAPLPPKAVARAETNQVGIHRDGRNVGKAVFLKDPDGFLIEPMQLARE